MRAVFENLPPRNMVFRTAAAPAQVSPPVVVLPDVREMQYLAQDREWLTELAAGSDGAYRPLAEMGRLFPRIAPRKRVEHSESAWRMWDAWTVFVLIITALTLEWVWRKLAGLV